MIRRLASHHWILATGSVICLGYYFAYDLITFRRYFTHAEFTFYYPAFRHWFLEQLLSGNFPKWNPYWGIGQATDIASTFPIDLFSLVEWIVGPKDSALYLARAWSVLGVGFLGFRWFGLSPLIAASCAWLFLLSPWVNWFFFYPMHVNSYLGILLAAPAAYHWFRTRQAKYWIFSAWISVLALLGTKLEFWFFHVGFLTCFGTVAALVFQGSTKKAVKSCLLFSVALALGILVHAWQWIALLQILKESGRVEASAAKALFNSEMYLSLFRSVVSSPFLSITLPCLSAAGFLRTRGRARFIAGYCLVLFIFTGKLWANPLFHVFYGAYSLGAAIALVVWALDERPNWRRLIESICLFIPLSYYWCRFGDGDVKEIEVLHKAPDILKMVFGALSFWGSCRVTKNRLARIFYVTLLLLFIIRDQGQILMCYLAGFYWIPTRDNFLFDLLFMALGGIGISGFGRARAALLATLILALSLFATRQDLYYSNRFVKTVPSEPPTYEGILGGEAVISRLKDRPDWRGYFIPSFGHGFESVSLLNQASDVSAYSSLLPARYRDWVFFRTYLIHPDEKLNSHPGQYTPETMANLPKRNTFGWDNDTIYFWRIEARPPFEINSLKLLGVRDVISDEPFPHSDENLTDYRQIGRFFSARVHHPLPRAYILDDVPTAMDEELSEFMMPRIFDAGIQLGGKVRPLRESRILRYERENVLIDAEARADSVLVLSDLYHPFWRVRVDGKEARQFPVFHAFRGLRLAPGRHRVEFYCEIPWFLFGWITTAIFLSVLAALTLRYLNVFQGRRSSDIPASDRWVYPSTQSLE